MKLTVTQAMIEAGGKVVWPWLYECGAPGMRQETEDFIRVLLEAAIAVAPEPAEQT